MQQVVITPQNMSRQRRIRYWALLQAVKDALRIPVLANGNVRNLEEALECMRYTGTDGVMSADPLLANPALFAAAPSPRWADTPAVRGCRLLQEYLDVLEAHPTHSRMVRGHVHKMLGAVPSPNVPLLSPPAQNVAVEGWSCCSCKIGQRPHHCGCCQPQSHPLCR